jgi:phosphate:Na+ symporter
MAAACRSWPFPFWHVHARRIPKGHGRPFFQKFLRKHTKNRIKAVFAGTLVTAILQSSSMVSLLVMSFAGAGIIGLKNGIGMILGTNLGTTVTGWLVSLIGFKLDIGSFIMPFLAVGGLGIIFFKSEKLSQISKFLMGFSFMFLGLNYMKNGFHFLPNIWIFPILKHT